MADDDLSALRATAHPLRLRMLSLVTATSMSAAEVARELGITHANASYHLRVLLKAGTIVVEGEEQIRGGRAKRYRHRWQDSPLDGAHVGEDERRQFLTAVLAEAERRYAHRRETERATLSDAELWVPREVWNAASEHLRAAADLVHDAALPPRTDDAVRISLTTIGFEMDEGEEKE